MILLKGQKFGSLIEMHLCNFPQNPQIFNKTLISNIYNLDINSIKINTFYLYFVFFKAKLFYI